MMEARLRQADEPCRLFYFWFGGITLGHSPSRVTARAALRLALTSNRQEEAAYRQTLESEGIRTAAADYGGEFTTAVRRIVERAVVAAKREGVIKETHSDEGAVAGAVHEALGQVLPKAIGLNVGGKIGIARKGEHIAVAVYFGIGLLHL